VEIVEHLRSPMRPGRMPRFRPFMLGLSALAALVVGGRVLSEIAPDAPVSSAGEREEEELIKPLSQPWSLGSSASDARMTAGDGGPAIGWSAEQPVGLEIRHRVIDGVTAHVGAEAAMSDDPRRLGGGDGSTARDRDALGQLDWQAGAGLRVRLDDNWSAGVGASWRSSRTPIGWDAAMNERGDARLDGEGVVWLSLRAEF